MDTTTEKAHGMNGSGRTEGSALVRRDEAIAAPSPYEPQSMDQALVLAKNYAGSRLTKARTPEQAFLIMATGRELGIPATTALRMIYVADFGQGDQVALSADLMVALCLRRSDICEYFDCIESTDEIATYATKRTGRPERRLSFTAKDKERARLGLSKDGKASDSSNWAKYPATMLKHRAASLLAREVYPDVIGGFYTEDEAQEIALVNARVETVQPLSPPAERGVIVDAPRSSTSEAAESDEQRVARFESSLRSANSEAEAQPTVKAIIAAYPDKKSAQRVQLKKVLDERKAANWSPEPPHDPETGEVHEEPAANLDDPDAFEEARAKGQA